MGKKKTVKDLELDIKFQGVNKVLDDAKNKFQFLAVVGVDEKNGMVVSSNLGSIYEILGLLQDGVLEMGAYKRYLISEENKKQGLVEIPADLKKD